MSISMGTAISPLLQQESLTLVFVSLGLGIIGMGFGRIKNKDSFQLHRWIMTGAIALNLIAIFVVMFPSLYIFYSNPSNSMISSFSILQIVHMIVGFPATVLALLFAFKDLPQPTNKWMRVTAILWLTSIALGAIVYFTMPS
jgi:uncharacterized membrane protein YozB (DUF420 family)